MRPVMLKILVLAAFVTAFLLFVVLRKGPPTSEPHESEPVQQSPGNSAQLVGRADPHSPQGAPSGAEATEAAAARLRILDPSGRPVSGATVAYGAWVSATRFNGTSDGSGVVTLAEGVVDANCVAEVTAPEFAPLRVQFWARGRRDVTLRRGCEVWLLHPDTESLGSGEVAGCTFTSGGSTQFIELSGTRTSLGRLSAGTLDILSCEPFSSGRVRYALPDRGRIEITVHAMGRTVGTVRFREKHGRMEGASLTIGSVTVPALPQIRAHPASDEPSEFHARLDLPGEYQFHAVGPHGSATGSFVFDGGEAPMDVQLEWARGSTLEVELPSDFPDAGDALRTRLFLVPDALEARNLSVSGTPPGHEGVRRVVSLGSSRPALSGFEWPKQPQRDGGALRWVDLPRGLSATALVSCEGWGAASARCRLDSEFVSVPLPSSTSVQIEVAGSDASSGRLDVNMLHGRPVGPSGRRLLQATVSLPHFRVTAPHDHGPVTLLVSTPSAAGSVTVADWSTETIQLELAPRRRSTRRVAVHDERGSPLGGVDIQFRSRGGDVQLRRTDQRGECEAQMPLGEPCRVSTFGPRFLAASASAPVQGRAELVSAEAAQLEIRYEGPAQLLRVQLGGPDDARPRAVAGRHAEQWNFAPGSQVLIPRLRPGKTHLSIRTEGEEPKVLLEADVVLIGGETHRIEVTDG